MTGVRVHGDIIPANSFRTWAGYVSTLEAPDVTTIGNTAFQDSFASSNNLILNFPEVTSVGDSAFAGSTRYPVSMSFPKWTNVTGSNKFTVYARGNLQTVLFGSVGHPVTMFANNLFLISGSYAFDITCTIYTDGAYADTAIANARNKLLDATIIIKAAVDTTYGGNIYSAGETIITSTPT